ncbi:hypothetical protein B0A49_13768, partial [Cryomyces minteri]
MPASNSAISGWVAAQRPGVEHKLVITAKASSSQPSGRVWKMQWNKGNGTMDCVISAPETLSDATRLKKITPEPDIFKDVCMEIGKLGGQNYKKISVQRMKQTLIYKSMDFSLSKEVIHTSLGDLVCDDVPTGH